MNNDSKHEIVENSGVINGELHRFVTGNGQHYSAIYQNGEELYSCPRTQEQQMIHHWNENKIYER